MWKSLRAALVLGGLVILGGWAPAFGQSQAGFDRQVLRIGHLISSGDSLNATEASALRGARLGAQETARTAELLDRQFELITETANGDEAPQGHDLKAPVRQAARRMIEEDSVFAIVGGSDTAACEVLSDVAARHDVLFFNTGCNDDALRGQHCHRNTFHIAASATMHRKARSTDASPVLWHPTLFRYGAKQLNQRFEEAFEHAMDGPAWSNWAAVKILWEAALRARTTDAQPLIRFLESEQARFDGHKGRSLTFRPWNHQLRQPLYAIRSSDGSAATEAVEEVPQPSNQEQYSTRDFLDQIGIGENETTCRFQPMSE